MTKTELITKNSTYRFITEGRFINEAYHPLSETARGMGFSIKEMPNQIISKWGVFGFDKLLSVHVHFEQSCNALHSYCDADGTAEKMYYC